MDETSDQIEQHIQETRNDLGENFNELGDKVKKAVDWRAQFEERPGTMLGLAFAGGVILSAVLPAGRRSRSAYAGSGSPPGGQAWSPSRPSSPPPASKPSETRQSVEALAGALISVAVNGASRFIDSLMPGFEREFSSARAGKNASARSDSGTSRAPTPRLDQPLLEPTDSCSS
jgi:hypothetical protein